jgi:hypothetical protein
VISLTVPRSGEKWESRCEAYCHWVVRFLLPIALARLTRYEREIEGAVGKEKERERWNAREGRRDMCAIGSHPIHVQNCSAVLSLLGLVTALVRRTQNLSSHSDATNPLCYLHFPLLSV